MEVLSTSASRASLGRSWTGNTHAYASQSVNSAATTGTTGLESPQTAPRGSFSQTTTEGTSTASEDRGQDGTQSQRVTHCSPAAHEPTVAPATSTQPVNDLRQRRFPVCTSRGDMLWFPFMPMISGRWRPDDYRKRRAFVIPELRTIMEEDCDLRPHVISTIFDTKMVGRTPREAEPSMIIHCREKILKSLKARFHNGGIDGLGCYDDSILHKYFKQRKTKYAPFKMVYHATNKPLSRPMTEGQIEAVLLSEDTLCGALVTYQHRSATAGVLLAIDGMDAMLTVDHLFHPKLAGDSSDGGPLSRSASGAAPLEETEILTTIPENQTRPLSLKGHLLPTPNRLDARAPYLDWSLMKLGSPRQNLFFPEGPHKSHTVSDTVGSASLSEPVPIYMISGTRALKTGYMLDNFSYLGSNPGQKLCQAWPMILTDGGGPQRLLPGESGSIVVHQSTFEVYGHVVASDALGQAYVVPLEHSLEQIKQCFAAQNVGLFIEPVAQLVAGLKVHSSTLPGTRSNPDTATGKGKAGAVDFDSDDDLPLQNEPQELEYDDEFREFYRWKNRIRDLEVDHYSSNDVKTKISDITFGGASMLSATTTDVHPEPAHATSSDLSEYKDEANMPEPSSCAKDIRSREIAADHASPLSLLAYEGGSTAHSAYGSELQSLEEAESPTIYEEHVDTYTDAPHQPSASVSEDEALEGFSISPSNDFERGRIFMTYWIEPRGGQSSLTEHSNSSSGYTAYAMVRKFIVMSDRTYGSSIALPLMTYGNRGCTKKGVKAHLHGIVYDEQEQPVMLALEPKLGFEPVRARMYDVNETLHPATRVNYSKLCTIEHNTAVRFIGEIIPEDWPIAKRAYRKIWLKAIHPRTKGREDHEDEQASRQ